MGKIKEKISFFLLFSLILTNLFSNSIYVAKAAGNTTKINIVKVKVSDTNLKAKDHTGKKIENDKLAEHFGEMPEFLPNVKFVVYDVKSSDNLKKVVNANTTSKIDTEAKLKQQVAGATKKTEVITNAQGVAEIASLEDGYYWILEEVKPAGYKNAEAVPFALTLPLYDGVGKLSEVWIYPKNTVLLPFDPRDPQGPDSAGKEPTLKKTVTDSTTKRDSYNKGQEEQWFIQLIAPEGIESLKHLIIRENVDTRLDFKDNSVQVKLKNTSETVLQASTDYTLTKPNGTQRKLEVKFTATGLAKIKKDDKIIVSYTTSINDTAQMGAAIYNGVQIVWGQGEVPDYYSEIKPSPDEPTAPTKKDPAQGNSSTTGNTNIPEPQVPNANTPLVPPDTDKTAPEIHLGGKKFVKKDNTTQATLQDAKFIIKNAEGKVLKTDYTWAEAPSDMSENNLNTSNIMVIKSATNGTFEIKGLKFGTYTIVEIQAPNNYALPSNPSTEIVIDKDSYADVTPVAEIFNTKLTIPQTGGIGTMIFIVAGILIMMSALFIAYRNKKSIN